MTIEEEFFEAFKPIECEKCNDKYCVNAGTEKYPTQCSKHKKVKITSEIVLGLEEILFKSVFNDGIHIHSPFDDEYNSDWSYQLTYYKGGYYICGYGDTRANALLDQFVTIAEDEEIEKSEKEFIIDQVRALFKNNL